MEPEGIQLGDTIYEKESLTEHGNKLINDLQKINDKINDEQLTLSIFNLAKYKLIEELKLESDKFKEIT